jgi:hypothetical protein
MDHIALLFNIGFIFGPQVHVLSMDVDGAVPDRIILLFSYKVTGASSKSLNFQESVFHHHHFGAQLLCQVKKDFLFAKCVAVDEELVVLILVPKVGDKFTHLCISQLLRGEVLTFSAKGVVHIQVVDMILASVGYLFEHLWSVSEVTRVQYGSFVTGDMEHDGSRAVISLNQGNFLTFNGVLLPCFQRNSEWAKMGKPGYKNFG